MSEYTEFAEMMLLEASKPQIKASGYGSGWRYFALNHPSNSGHNSELYKWRPARW